MATTITGSRSFAAFDFFFDRPRVMRAISSYRRRVLSKQGAYARRVMQTNQRYGGKSGISSQPGEFPRAQEGSLRRLTFFAYDASRDDAVVGPVGFARLPRGYTLQGASTIPQLLNEGGVAIFDPSEGEQSRADRFRRIRGRRRASAGASPAQKSKRRRGGIPRRTRQRRYRIEPRPFIRLTQEIIAPKLADIAASVPFR